MKPKTIDCRVIFRLNKKSCSARAREAPRFPAFVFLTENGIGKLGKLKKRSNRLKITKGPEAKLLSTHKKHNDYKHV